MLRGLLRTVGLTKGLPPLPPGRRDVTLGDPQAKKVKVHLEKGEWQSVRDAIQVAHEISMRALLLDVCADVGADKPARWIEEWLKAYPEDPLTWTLRGAVNTEASRRIRVAAKEEETPDEQWSEMYELMDSARKQLKRAVDLEPKDAVPWRYLLMIAIATSEPMAIRQELYNEGRSRSGAWYGLDHIMLTSLAERSGGAHDLMFRFARNAASAARGGTPFPALIAEAHYERALYASAFDYQYLSPVDYFQHDSSLRSEILQASDKAEGVAGASAVVAANWFAFAFTAMGDFAHARLWLDRMHGVYLEPPWSADTYEAAINRINKKFS
jgi:hypothetical protein